LEDVTQRAVQDEAPQKSFTAARFESVTNSDVASDAGYLNEIARWRPIVEKVGQTQE
jgi:hypothetical protein